MRGQQRLQQQAMRMPRGYSEWLPYLLAFSIFSREIFGVYLMGSIFDVYQLSLAAIGIFQIRSLRRLAPILWSMLAMLILGAFLLTTYGYSYGVLLKQGAAIVFVYLGYGSLLLQVKPNALLRAYKLVVLYAAIFGIIQWVFSYTGVMLLMKAAGRLDSLAYEPSHYAVAIAPAVFLALWSLIRKRHFRDWKSWVIVISMCLTVSLTSVIVMFVCVAMVTLNKKGIWMALAVVAGMVWLLSNPKYLPKDISSRIEASQTYSETGGALDKQNNSSVLSAASNWKVAKTTIERGRILGNGLGGNSYAYHEILGNTGFALHAHYGANDISGHCLLIRCISEFGIIGVIFYGFWMMRGIKAIVTEQQIWRALSAVYLVGRMVKIGGFMDYGMPVYMMAPIIFYGGRSLRRKNDKRK
ncbi:hypothetical protein N9733_05875 [Akkermansiaceae bacterium]|nr:hypothetical protein [Akkermansiaceae bacterium]